jgi:hypothetical protein
MLRGVFFCVVIFSISCASTNALKEASSVNETIQNISYEDDAIVYGNLRFVTKIKDQFCFELSGHVLEQGSTPITRVEIKFPNIGPNRNDTEQPLLLTERVDGEDKEASQVVVVAANNNYYMPSFLQTNISTKVEPESIDGFPIDSSRIYEGCIIPKTDKQEKVLEYVVARFEHYKYDWETNIHAFLIGSPPVKDDTLPVLFGVHMVPRLLLFYAPERREEVIGVDLEHGNSITEDILHRVLKEGGPVVAKIAYKIFKHLVLP